MSVEIVARSAGPSEPPQPSILCRKTPAKFETQAFRQVEGMTCGGDLVEIPRRDAEPGEDKPQLEAESQTFNVLAIFRR